MTRFVYHLKRIKKGGQVRGGRFLSGLDGGTPDPRKSRALPCRPSMSIRLPRHRGDQEALEMIQAEVTEGVDFA